MSLKWTFGTVHSLIGIFRVMMVRDTFAIFIQIENVQNNERNGQF